MKHVFLVDDDSNFRRSLAIQLEFEGYRVTDVGSAVDGISYLDRCAEEDVMPDVVITDLRMHPMIGEDFVRHLREHFPRLPFLIISAFELPADLAECTFLRKPFRLEELIDKMNRVDAELLISVTQK